MLKKYILIILLALFLLAAIIGGFLISNNKSSESQPTKKMKENIPDTPTKSVDESVVPFGIQGSGLPVPAVGGGGPGNPSK